MSFPWLKPSDKTLTLEQKNPIIQIQSHLNSLKLNLNSAVKSIADNANNAIKTALSLPAQTMATATHGGRPWAFLSAEPEHRFDLAMASADIEERLAGVPVYALSNSTEEFVLVSGRRTGKNLGLFCFKREDAESLLEQMKAMNANMREGSKVVALALSKVCQLKVDGVAFRFIPDSTQVANAMREKEKIGEQIDGFSGVPVFQSRSLVLKSQNKRYRPVFFRKEDLEDSLFRASREQRQLNPALRKGDIQVCVLEDIIKSMTEKSASKWDDVVFIPPGFEVSTDLSQIARC